MKLKAAEESGMTVEHIQIASDAEAGEGAIKGQGVRKVLEAVKKANSDPSVNGLLVQLPLEGATSAEEQQVAESVAP